MEEAPGIDFRPTAAQRRILEGGPRVIGGRSGGRRYATEMFIVATAATEEDRELALEDLRTKGIAALTDEGKRIDPTARRRRFAVVKFDEEPRRVADCPDCDGSGCEHCGGTGRRWVS